MNKYYLVIIIKIMFWPNIHGFAARNIVTNYTIVFLKKLSLVTEIWLEILISSL